MAIPYFLAFIGCVLGSSIALAVVAKNLSEGLALSGKKPFVYGSVSAVITSGLAYAGSLIQDGPVQFFWLLGGLFLLFGSVHVAWSHRRYFQPQRYKRTTLGAELVFGLSVVLFTVLVFSSLQYFLRDRQFLFYPLLMSALVFFVPLLFYHSFEAAFLIPATTYPTWQYPLHKPIALPDEDESRDRIVVIGFEIAKKAGDARKTYFRAKGPETMRLGEFFYHFMNEYNGEYSDTAIEYTGRGFEPFSWWFCRKPKWFAATRIYDPERSIRENGIRENTVIVCERLPIEAPAVQGTLKISKPV